MPSKNYHSNGESVLGLFTTRLARKWWGWAVLAAVFLAALSLIFIANVKFVDDYREFQNATPVAYQGRAALVRVLIDFGGTLRAFEGEAEGGMTLESAFREIAAAGKLRLDISKGEIGLLGDKKSGPRGRWKIYINDEAVSDLARELKGGERIAIRYE